MEDFQVGERRIISWRMNKYVIWLVILRNSLLATHSTAFKSKRSSQAEKDNMYMTKTQFLTPDTTNIDKAWYQFW